VWTFHLRDFNWADGKPVTAKDFVYSWRRLLNPKTASQYAAFAYCVKGAQAYNEGKGQAEDVGVKAVDDKTFEVTLEYAVPYFINLTAFSNLYPLRQDSVEAGGEKYGQDPAGIIGNGPFVISEWVKGSKAVLKKNDKYWDAKSVKLQTVTINVVKEDAPRMQMFSNKQIDTVLAKAEYKDKFSELAKKGEVVMTSSYDPSEAFEFFNVGDKSKLFRIRKSGLHSHLQ
jgi:oligopeptide transport system substrate-binding protein